jgi:hypothetical protein
MSNIPDNIRKKEWNSFVKSLGFIAKTWRTIISIIVFFIPFFSTFVLIEHYDRTLNVTTLSIIFIFGIVFSFLSCLTAMATL